MVAVHGMPCAILAPNGKSNSNHTNADSVGCAVPDHSVTTIPGVESGCAHPRVLMLVFLGTYKTAAIEETKAIIGT
jgi:hypothetical protein